MISKFWLAIVAILACLALRSACYTVDPAEYVYITQFGRPIATLDGATEAGLHFKWPWPVQSVQRLDHRLQVLDLPGVELLTHDPKGNTIDQTLSISAFVCWRIPDAASVDRFVRTVGAPERAEALLGQQIGSRLGAEIGNMRQEDLISPVPSEEAAERMDRLSRRLLDGGTLDPAATAPRQSLREAARQAYGIELVDIRLRRLNYPPQVREAIFDRIRSERNKKVADYQSEGAQRAEDIKSQAEYLARTMLAEARAAEQRLKGEADAEADRIRNAAQSKNAAFYAFLKKLSEYQRILGDNKTVLLLSSHRELFDVLFKPPSPEPPAPAAVSSKPSSKSGGQ